MQQQAAYEEAVLRAMIEENQRRWRELLALVMQMSDTELRAALGSPAAELRFTAAYVVGEKGRPWPRDLIPLLQDRTDGVRQSARRSLIILSFLALNPDIAERLRPQRPDSSTSSPDSGEDARTRRGARLFHVDRPPSAAPAATAAPDKPVPPVDFGPRRYASIPARAEAAQRWTKWWDDREPRTSSTATLRSGLPPTEPDPEQLAKELVQAVSRYRWEVLSRFQSTRGVQYTEALALAAAQVEGESRRRIRDALSGRMTRMKDTTLVRYLADDEAEIRRAAALGLGQRQSVACADKVIELLLDPDPAVEQAAHAALRQLSNGKDFGPSSGAPDADRVQAAARWRDWWRTR